MAPWVAQNANALMSSPYSAGRNSAGSQDTYPPLVAKCLARLLLVQNGQGSKRHPEEAGPERSTEAAERPKRQRNVVHVNEEHSIGGARWLKVRRWKESVRRALPIEFVELSRTGTYGD